MEKGDLQIVVAKQRLLGRINIQPDGCWLITSGLTRLGYARMMVNYEFDLAHRWSYRVFKGPIPDDLNVLHSCDRPNCVNPEHLSAGTQSENICQAVTRGRYVKNRGGAKLSWKIADDIRGSAERTGILAKRYGVCTHTIADIRSKRTWVR